MLKGRQNAAGFSFLRSPVEVRRLPMRVNISGRGAPDGRARVSARREGVLEANGVFSILD